MFKLLRLVSLALLVGAPSAWSHQHGHDEQAPLFDAHDFASKSGSNGSPTWTEKYGKQIDQTFSGPLSFSHLPYSLCLEDDSAVFDVAVLGMPFDTAVTYRPGARFGPFAIRSGSRRQREQRGYTLSWKNNPYELGSKIIDCGDVWTCLCLIAGLDVLITFVTPGPRQPVRQCPGGRPNGGGLRHASFPPGGQRRINRTHFSDPASGTRRQAAPAHRQVCSLNGSLYI